MCKEPVLYQIQLHKHRGSSLDDSYRLLPKAIHLNTNTLEQLHELHSVHILAHATFPYSLLA